MTRWIIFYFFFFFGNRNILDFYWSVEKLPGSLMINVKQIRIKYCDAYVCERCDNFCFVKTDIFVNFFYDHKKIDHSMAYNNTFRLFLFSFTTLSAANSILFDILNSCVIRMNVCWTFDIFYTFLMRVSNILPVACIRRSLLREKKTQNPYKRSSSLIYLD